MPFLLLEHVTKDFGSVRAVDDLSLSIEEGEMLVLLGPSGSGKTTTLRLVAGLENPTEGTILRSGKDLARVPPSERDMAMVFQSGALWPHLSVRQNVEIGWRLRQKAERPWWRRWRSNVRSLDSGSKRNQDHLPTLEVAELLGMAPLLDRYPAEISGGEQQRIALARALACRPRMLLFDEPLASLDPPLRMELRRQIRRLHDQLGLTSLYVTHDQSEAMALATRIALLDRGRLRQVGSPRELYDHPADAIVATFLGRPGINMLEGAIIHGNGLAFEADGLFIPLSEPVASIIGASSGSRLILGVRPEHLAILAPGAMTAPESIGFDGTVIGVEWQGDHSLVTIQCGGPVIVAKTPPPGPPTSASIRLAAPIRNVHFFDALSGQTRRRPTRQS